MTMMKIPLAVCPQFAQKLRHEGGSSPMVASSRKRAAMSGSSVP